MILIYHDIYILKKSRPLPEVGLIWIDGRNRPFSGHRLVWGGVPFLGHIPLAKLKYFTNQNLPEIRGPIARPKSHLFLLAQVV